MKRCWEEEERRGQGRWWWRVGSIHGLGLVGHIEDIAVAKDQQGKKLGLRIIQALDYVAEKVGCYKVSCCCCWVPEGVTPRADSWMRLRTEGMRKDGRWLLICGCSDDIGLLRGQRGLLRQVWVQESGFGNGTLLRFAEG